MESVASVGSTNELKTKGSMTFWLREGNWLTDDSNHSLGEVASVLDVVDVHAKKNWDCTISLTVSGPFGQTFKFRRPIPPCDKRGLFVAITWADSKVTLYLNGKLVGVKTAST